MRQTDLVLLYRGGSSSSQRGVAFPVILRNSGVGTFWDVVVRMTHDGEETDREVIARLGPQSETDPSFLLIPALLCDQGTPGVGLRPRGQAVAEASVNDEVVARVDLPGGGVDPGIDRVPRTDDEEATLLRVRPDGWEYLLFAAVLRRRLDASEPKYRDHELGFARPGRGPRLGGAEATEFLAGAFGESSGLVENIDRIFDSSVQERAFGALGEPGDAERIEHMASRVIDVYDGLLDWAARLRATPVEEEFERARNLASRYVDLPIEQFRDFVARVVAEIDRLPALLRAATDEPTKLSLTLSLDIDQDVQDALHAELRRLEELHSVEWSA